MRLRSIVLVLASASTLAMGGLVAACGNTSDDTVVDAGPDVTTQDAMPDVAPDVQDAAPPSDACTVDGDLNNLNVPNAAIGDAGGSVPACAACLKTSCSSDINDCNNLCECKGAIISLYDCLGNGQSLTSCGLLAFAGVGSDTQAIGFSLIGCAQKNCYGECGLSAFLDGGAPDGGGDAGIQDAGGQ